MGIKRVLITAGPTWVAIDKVRVISNIATGETGILLAHKFQAAGYKVTLLLGPVESVTLNNSIKLVRFRFFDELKGFLTGELKARKYDIVIHSAAVSDYRPLKIFKGKISSGIKRLKLELAPTLKIISLIKKIDPSVFLVGFKFEPGASKEKLIREARNLIRVSALNLAFANSVDKKGYLAYIVGEKYFKGPFRNKKIGASKLMSAVREKTCRG